MDSSFIIVNKTEGPQCVKCNSTMRYKVSGECVRCIQGRSIARNGSEEDPELTKRRRAIAKQIETKQIENYYKGYDNE